MAIAYKHLSDRVPKPSAAVANVPKELDGFVRRRPTATASSGRRAPSRCAATSRRSQSGLPGRPLARRRSSPTCPRSSRRRGASPRRVAARGIHDADDPPHRAHEAPPASARFSGILLLLVALAASAWGVWTYLVPHHADVPPVIGTPVDDAKATLIDLGFNVKIADDGVYQLDIPAGSVAKVAPPAGTVAREGRDGHARAVARSEAREGARPRGQVDRGSRTHPGSARTSRSER